jgi:hypothetical protein
MHGSPLVSDLVLSVWYGHFGDALASFVLTFFADENHVAVQPVVKEEGNLLLVVFFDCLQEASGVTPLLQVLLLFRLKYDFTTDLTLGRVPVALNSVSSCLRRAHLLLAVGTHHWFVWVPIITIAV